MMTESRVVEDWNVEIDVSAIRDGATRSLWKSKTGVAAVT
jgi:hypothetical protein